MTTLSPTPFEQAYPQIEAEILRWFEERDYDLTSSGVKGTLDTNTTRVPQRGDAVLRALKEFTPLTDLAGKKVLDIGCGYGAIGMYLHQISKTAEWVAVDPDESFLTVARNVSQAINLTGFSVLKDDMTSLQLPQGEFDLILVHNAYIYLPKSSDIQKSVQHFHRLLKPGGQILIYGPNRWYYREAFTKLVGVQFMPYWLANWYVKKKGVMNAYDHLRLLSPWDFYQFFNFSGFKDLQIISLAKKMGNHHWRRLFQPYFYFSAVKR